MAGKKKKDRKKIKDLPKGKGRRSKSDPELLTPDEMDKVSGGIGNLPLGGKQRLT